MSSLKNRNINFNLKVFALITFLFSTTRYTEFIYRYSIYPIVIFGSIFFLWNIFRRNFKLNKIDYASLVFLIGFVITILLNKNHNIILQGFVLLCTMMYFNFFFSSDLGDSEELERENHLIMYIIVAFTLTCAIISFIVLRYDLVNKLNHSFVLHGGTEFQLKGIYSGLATQAIMSGISAIASMYFIYSELTLKRRKKIIAINGINFLIEDCFLTMSYTSAGIVAFGVATFVGLFLIFNNEVKKKNQKSYFIIGIIIIFILVLHYKGINYTSKKIVNSMFDSSYYKNLEIKSDDASDELFSSNGRFEIWKNAIASWENKPIFGNGYGTFNTKIPIKGGFIKYKNTHNGYIEVLYSCGLWGFISMMVFGTYYLSRLIFISIVNKKREYVLYSMIVIHACLYCCVNQQFILDRCLNMLLLCIFLGMTRKQTILKKG